MKSKTVKNEIYKKYILETASKDFILDTPEHLRCTQDTSNPTPEAADSSVFYESYTLGVDSMTTGGSCSFQSEHLQY